MEAEKCVINRAAVCLLMPALLQVSLLSHRRRPQGASEASGVTSGQK